MATKPDRIKVVKAVETFRQAKADAEHTEAARKEQQEAAVELMKGAGIKTLSYEAGEVAIKATLMENDRLTYDEAGMRKALGAKVWAKVTKPKLDQQLLEGAIASGLVDPTIVAQHTELKPVTPFIRITQKEA